MTSAIDRKNNESGLKYLFGSEYRRWVYETPYLMYVTPECVTSRIMSIIAREYALTPLSVTWDMFAGIGTDSIELSKYSSVIATEINPETHKHQETNLATFGVTNVTSILSDCTDMIDRLNASVNLIYFDPPWGETFRTGYDFDFSQVKLSNGKEVVNLAQEVQNKITRNIVIKSPITSCTFDILFESDIALIYTFPQQKLKFILLK